MLVVWRSIFRFWGGGANQTAGSSGFPGAYTRNKRGIAGSVLMMGAVVRGWGRVRDRFSRQFFCFSRDTAMASAFDLDEQFVFVLFLLLVSR